MHSFNIIITLIVINIYAFSVPDNLAQLYRNHKAGCKNVIASGFNDGTSASRPTQYCGDIPGALFISTAGGYADMDVDCDGASSTSGGCGNDPSNQGQTTFQDQVRPFGINNLNANIHPYVVFGNTNFSPQQYGVQPLSVMVVVCGEQLFYGIWGDTNGGSKTGEASISLARLCFGSGISGNSGHSQADVLYLAFTSGDAVPGGSAAWTATSTDEFQRSIKSLGDQLVAGLGT
ncbi:glycoside hydrolase family 75 protein [Aspergillus homomorphus CBS 101889]|uniref:Endo-chitosanase n=1 Tax=Aspergillus homomorphus (strain CBS 101889) TaxID=1450537 RepID=A0A395I026_ASPHC|nr:putative chitosanase [Aspergillus homomorphus CBS 101889]RAL13410.1 putative chitosanase [Aspergillus homomorphus CBS 101889]